jgi:hypothetical protein
MTSGYSAYGHGDEEIVPAIAGSITVHGFRSSFHDWCRRTVRRDIAGAALAHAVRVPPRRYSEPVDQRRAVRALGRLRLWGTQMTDAPELGKDVTTQ